MKIVMAEEGVFLSVQGEGSLLGVPMVFVRLGGCSVGCEGCDTQYRPFKKEEVNALVGECRRKAQGAKWVWITGGEPADQPGLAGLVDGLRKAGFKVAVATSGMREVWGVPDWLSVSPHGTELKVSSGSELKMVFGLNGFWPDDGWLKKMESDFSACWAMPLMVKEGAGWQADRESLKRCLEVVRGRENWLLGCQAHRLWGVP